LVAFFDVRGIGQPLQQVAVFPGNGFPFPEFLPLPFIQIVKHVFYKKMLESFFVDIIHKSATGTLCPAII
jgi:hypothetical protein